MIEGYIIKVQVAQYTLRMKLNSIHFEDEIGKKTFSRTSFPKFALLYESFIGFYFKSKNISESFVVKNIHANLPT